MEGGTPNHFWEYCDPIGYQTIPISNKAQKLKRQNKLTLANLTEPTAKIDSGIIGNLVKNTLNPSVREIEQYQTEKKE